MGASIYPNYPPETTPEGLQYLLSNLKDWSIAHGLAVRPSPAFIAEDIDPSGVLANTAPVTLFPSPFPAACFEEARDIQTSYNELYAAIAEDEEWLKEIVEELIDVDDFIAKLWEIHLNVKKEGYVQDISLGLFRSDYMVHVDPSSPSSKPEIKQVEFNTIASSFGGLSSQVSLLHKYTPTPTAFSLISTNPQSRHLLSISAFPQTTSSLITPQSLPENPTIPSLTSGLAAAHTAYGPSKSTPSLPLCILFIVQPSERNVFDQRHLEYALQTTHSIPVFRLPLSSVLQHTHIPPSNRTRPLHYHPPHSPNTAYEVTVLYFRAGYSPTDYNSPTTWTARLHLERSAAIKCPTILTHLAGSKKIQQVLALPSSPHLARFLPANNDTTARVRKTFAAIYPLDHSPAGRKAKALATNPHPANAYVLKPQREGGGNNIYRAAIPPFLASVPEQKWKGYILMEIINPPALSNSILRNGAVETGGVIGELGVYGVCLWRTAAEAEAEAKAKAKARMTGSDGADTKGDMVEEEGSRARGVVMLENFEAGYLLRTKGVESEEGGVAAGFGAVDSCLLV